MARKKSYRRNLTLRLLPGRFGAFARLAAQNRVSPRQQLALLLIQAIKDQLIFENGNQRRNSDL